MTFERSYDPEIFEKAFTDPRYLNGVTPEIWLGNHDNLMYVSDDGSVGLCQFDYPGAGTVHWFFKETTRGRKAITLAKDMCQAAFDHGYIVLRGITQKYYPGARWAARQVGMKSYGFIDWPGYGECELFIMTKETK